MLIVLSPWAFAANDPTAEFALALGLAALLWLEAVRLCVEGGRRIAACPIAFCLAGLFLLGVVQLVPLPPAVLRVVSPNAARLDEELRPAQPEVIAGEAAPATPNTETSRPLSRYPAGTQAYLVQILSLFLVYSVVRNLLASPASLKRLAWVCLLNGTILAIVGIAQLLSSPPNVVYWSHTVAGAQVFGPFVCRNHFPYYLNLCIGLGAGLLTPSAGADEVDSRESDLAVRLGSLAGELTGLLHRPRNLWILTALAVMIASVPLSLSRGGVLSLFGGAALCLLFGRRSRARPSLSTAALSTTLAATALVAWLGWGLVEARLGTLLKEDALRQSRWTIWTTLWPLVPEYLATGTGNGTFGVVEFLHRTDPQTTLFKFEYAHNEYLEALIEGGFLRLGLTLALAYFALAGALRAARRWQGRATGRLALGCFFGLAAVTLHSFVDFGLHMPAVALLAVVIAAQMRAAADASSYGSSTGQESARPGIGAAITAVFLVLLGAVLAVNGWVGDRVHRYSRVAESMGRQPVPGAALQEIPFRDAAARLRPADALLQQELGLAHLRVFQEEERLLARERAVQRAASWVTLEPVAALGESPPLATIATLCAGERVEKSWPPEESVVREHLRPALRHLVTARDLCPLLPGVNAPLASYREFFAVADPAARYLERARILSPADPDVWYASGLQHLRDGNEEEAWKAWRRSLELSPRHLERVTDQAARRLSPAEFSSRVMPDRPELLVAAATHLAARPGHSKLQTILLERALVLWEARPGEPTGLEWSQRARARAELGQNPAAIADYRRALDREPLEDRWRLELAQLLQEEGQLAEARGQLIEILRHDPGSTVVRDRLEVVTRELRLQTGGP